MTDNPSYFPYYVNIRWMSELLPTVKERLEKVRTSAIRNPLKHRQRKILISKLPEIIAEMENLANVIVKDLHSLTPLDEEGSYLHAKSVYDLWNVHIKTIKSSLLFINPEWLTLLDYTHGLIPNWNSKLFEEGYGHAKQK